MDPYLEITLQPGRGVSSRRTKEAAELSLVQEREANDQILWGTKHEYSPKELSVKIHKVAYQDALWTTWLPQCG